MILPADDKSVTKLTNALNLENPVVIPTETVYGLAARIDQPEAIKKIFALKKRPFFDPLIVHIYDNQQLRQLTQFESPVLTELIRCFWPGPLTLVLPKLESVNPLITSGLDSVGIRKPSHPIALDVLRRVNVPLAAPSANLFGHTSPTKAIHVEEEFKEQNLLILDGGECQVGIESTVIKLSKSPKDQLIDLSLLRKGVVTRTQIEAALKKLTGHFRFLDQIDKRHSPGHTKHHYMPNIPLVYISQKIDMTSIIKRIESDFNKIPDVIDEIHIKKPKFPIKKWSPLTFSDDPVIACRELYSKLKSESEKNVDLLVFEKKSYMDLEAWEGFIERIYKASSLHY